VTPVRSCHRPPLLLSIVHSGANGHVWFVTSVLVTAEGE